MLAHLRHGVACALVDDQEMPDEVLCGGGDRGREGVATLADLVVPVSTTKQTISLSTLFLSHTYTYTHIYTYTNNVKKT